MNGLPFPSPGDLPNLRIESASPILQAYSLPTEPLGKPLNIFNGYQIIFTIYLFTFLLIYSTCLLTEDDNSNFCHIKKMQNVCAVNDPENI